MFKVYENGEVVSPVCLDLTEAAEYVNWWLGKYGLVGLAETLKANVPYRYKGGTIVIHQTVETGISVAA
jgi:hypothetical protein